MFYIVGNLENIDNSYNSMASSDIYGQPLVDTLQIRFVLFLVSKVYGHMQKNLQDSLWTCFGLCFVLLWSHSSTRKTHYQYGCRLMYPWSIAKLK